MMTASESQVNMSSTDDAVSFLVRQHREIRDRFDEVAGAEHRERREGFRTLLRLLAVHETAEEMVLHPRARAARPNGSEIVDARLGEEKDAKQLLSKLDGMDPESAEFAPLFEQLRVAVLAHAEAEEADEFPGLRSSTGESERRVMAMALRAAEAIAPTHPHMNANSAVANLALGPLASVMDHTRDVVREELDRAKRGGQN